MEICPYKNEREKNKTILSKWRKKKDWTNNFLFFLLMKAWMEKVKENWINIDIKKRAYKEKKGDKTERQKRKNILKIEKRKCSN